MNLPLTRLAAEIQESQPGVLQKVRDAKTMNEFDPWVRLRNALEEALEALTELKERGSI